MEQILDTSSEFIFGEAMGALENPELGDKITEAFAYGLKGTAIRSMLKMFKFLHRDEKWWAACKTMTDYADEHVEMSLQRLRERDSGRSQIKEGERLRLVDEMAKDTQDKLTLRSHIINTFSPAHDGASITLTNAMFHLARNPHVWAKLRHETLPTAHEPLTYDLLNSYRYLSHVLKESKSINYYMQLVFADMFFFSTKSHSICHTKPAPMSRDNNSPLRRRSGWKATPLHREGR